MSGSDEAKEHWSLRLNHHSPAPLWTQLAREIRRLTAEWSLPVGHSLPSVEFLSDQYAISPHIVREAYGALQDAGYIESSPEAGYYVAQAVSMEYVTVPPGSKVTAPAADPDMHPDLPSWIVVGIKVETPGMDTLWFDSTRTVLIVS